MAEANPSSGDANNTQFTEVELKMMRDVIRYIDTNQVQKIFRILGAD